jgi:hypothetical protein
MFGILLRIWEVAGPAQRLTLLTKLAMDFLSQMLEVYLKIDRVS